MLSDSANNSSVAPLCPDYRSTHRLHMVAYSLVLAAGLPLNALALWVFLRALRVHSVVSVYMCNLAASDLLFTLSLPVRISYYVRHYWSFPGLLCQAAGAIFQTNMYGSCIFLTLINVDRYAAIVHPLRLRHLRRPRVARLLCLGVWALIVVFAVPLVLVHRPSSCSYNGSQVHLCFESFGDSLWKGKLLPLVLLAEALGFLLPLAAMLYSSGRVFWTLARPDATRNQRRRKTVRLLLANLVIFLLCFVPYNTTLAVYGLLRGNLVAASGQACDRVRQVLVVMVLLAGANCVLDPLVYYFSAEGFRNTLRGLGTPLRARTLATNGAQGALAGGPTETTLITSPAPASQELLGPSNFGTPLRTQRPEDSAL
ncbi:lysophosphatidic acid receptor 5 [Callorhinus ursinus]|uniref:Lysophosphatidic acid receptor 5 n=1 Tax=Callorhinus ursinus TaxID=34884 RepID=A0A3Q7MLA0_CALUR|nr:lysophosphatidic acid receptor 5 [Callorhinus ursinus]XP_025707739.1 lysophosphatidic acid receptor 5 [Callorhinus ursinus]XP_025707740.1 lysophosphatidic acid receptor 5 [Callorhinus ursinus]XP_025707741.1 lysophosphatidic acid receptor 5 [Callorhinus ursinus]XP_025707742.1 lysophosphatidic acid receptor 5 [Callorhinus ursinus]XP_025707744.1 lysophosphatidic acid receptor 5 [Callorhinus ursinus]XP_025707745.1 lysophosphatidic acid receptor 5 [Callorhinus ursinus]XP_027976976.1 lysophosph